MNPLTEKELSTEIGKLTSLSSNLVEHIFYLGYVCVLHDMACAALGNDAGKLKEVSFNVPFIGDITLDVSKDMPEIKSCSFRKDFVTKLHNAAFKGESELEKEVRSKFITRLKNNYNNLI